MVRSKYCSCKIIGVKRNASTSPPRTKSGSILNREESNKVYSKLRKMIVVAMLHREYAGSIAPSYSVSSGEEDKKWEGGMDESMLPM